MRKTKKALASLAIAGMALTIVPFNAFANSAVPTRLGGTTAEQTAVQIADQTGYTGTAILASSASYGAADALTAGPLAAYLKAPILLQGPGAVLNADTKAELTKLNVKKVYVTSGTAVISQAVIDQLKGMSIEVVSLGGADRFETSVNIAKKLVELGAPVTKVAVAYGWLNQDALSIASVASAANEPIILTEKAGLSASAKAYLAANLGITAADVIGGTGVIDATVLAQLPNPTRHYGNTAYDTNNQVIQDFASSLEFDNVYVANGKTGIDALAGAPLAAQSKSAIVLTDGVSVPAVAAFTYSKSSASTIVTALGGAAVVPESIRAGVAAGQVTSVPGELSIVSVNALDDANQYLEVKFSKPVSGLQTSSFTIANADTQERYGVQAVTMSTDGLTATLQLYGNDNSSVDSPVLEYLQDYNVSVNVNGTMLTTVFNRSYSLKSRVMSIDPSNDKIYIVSEKKGSGDVAEGDTKTISIPSNVDFDYYAALGEQVQVWYNSDLELTSYKILTNTTKVDSIKVKDDNTITLLGEDKDYDITEDQYNDSNKDKFVFYNNDEDGNVESYDASSLEDLKDKKFNYAKIGFDSSGDITFVSAYTLKNSLIFDSMDDDEVVGINGSTGSFDSSDATIVKDNKVIDPSELKKGDLVLYDEDANDGDGYAQVVTKPVATGAIDEVYDNAIEVDGETYDYVYDSDVASDYDYSQDAVYINDEGDVDTIDQDAAEELQAAGDVAIYTDPAGNLLYVSGDTATVDSNTKVATLTDDIVGYKSSKAKIDVEAVTEDEDEVSYDINLDSLDKIIVDGTDYKIDNDASKDWTASLIADGNDFSGIKLTDNTGDEDDVEISFSADGAAGRLVKLHLDDDGDLQKLEFYHDASSDSDDDGDVGYKPLTSTIQADDSYVQGCKLTDNTLLFRADKADKENTDGSDYTVTKFGDYNGADITEGHFIYNDDQEVIAIWYSGTNSDDTDYEEAVVTKILRNTDDEVVSISGWVAGKEQTFKVDQVDDGEAVVKGDVVVLEFDSDNDTLVQDIDTDQDIDTSNPEDPYDQYHNRVTKGLTVEDIDAGAKKVTFSNGKTYKLADEGLVLNGKDNSDIKKKSLSDLDGENNVTVVLDAMTGTYAKFFVMETGATSAELLAEAKDAAGDAQTAYLAAGGLATDAVYTAVDTAVDGGVTATIKTKTTALEAATQDLLDADTALQAAKDAATAAQTAYTDAGGLATDAVYTAVDTAVDGGVTATIKAKTTLLEAATQDLVDAAAVVTALADVNAAGTTTEMKAALTANATVLELDLTDYNALSIADKNYVATALIDAITANGDFASGVAIQNAITAAINS
ncbi:cell wall-binding repeat-containing protein [Desulfosporosinus sp. OT]|uniref:cell wall-binding repeat-containing protein n=1 Tax=Desulfosporosinus sp. OT TaxID=913865 RepID=UPI000223A13F|nr:cell wall-binding repeat-containing protein [Desulfosporosinus sp. OT]EGW39900.1 cell wall binding repeat 2 family protein [Desulfosporosinus sp. OT]